MRRRDDATQRWIERDSLEETGRSIDEVMGERMPKEPPLADRLQEHLKATGEYHEGGSSWQNKLPPPYHGPGKRRRWKFWKRGR
jgi:hypothetical protein